MDKNWMIILGFIIFVFLLFAACIFFLLHFLEEKKTYEYKKIIIEDEKEIRELLLKYSDNEILEIHCVRNLSKPYMELVKVKTNNKNPKDPNNEEEISEEIHEINYYIKL